jgi:hypothetical protein
MSNESPQLRIPVGKKTRQALKQLALNQETSIAQITRDALQEYLSKRGIDIDMSDGIESWGGAGRKGKDEDEE